MKKLSLTLAAVVLAAAGARADWVLSDYATVTADSATTNATYGFQTYENSASAVTVTVPGGYVSLKATTVASDPASAPAGNGYSANVGLLHPLTSDWATHDLTGLTGITFEYRNSTKITDYFAVSFGSATYTDAIAKAGTTYEDAISGTVALAAGTTWKTATLDILDFAPPVWFKPIPAGYPSIGDVLTKVKNLQFAPKTTYTGTGSQNGTACNTCTAPTMTSQTLDIRNVTLVGPGISAVSDPNPGNLGCSDPSVSIFDDFVDGDTKSNPGGYWYNFSDYDSTQTGTDLAKGSSSSSVAVTAGDMATSGFITLNAGLKKADGTAPWHKYAGWAAVGVGFPGDGTADLTGLTGIQFSIGANVIGPQVKSLQFKVTQHGISDTATHVVLLPAASVVAGKTYCIRPIDLQQPSYVVGAVPLNVAKIDKMAWEAIITDNKSSTIVKDTASIFLTDVKFFGVADGYPVTTGLRTRKVYGNAFSASYADGALNIKGFAGVKTMDVFGLDGVKVASFAPSARVALSLPRGTYFLAGRREGSSLVKSFTVVGR